MGNPKAIGDKATALAGDETIDGLVAAHLGLQLPLMSFGFCTCCSGSLSLRRNAEVRGISLGTILADPNREIAGGA